MNRGRSISVYEMLKLRYCDITTNPRSSVKQKNESLEVLRNDILKIEWEYCMPGDVEQLLRKIELLIC